MKMGLRYVGGFSLAFITSRRTLMASHELNKCATLYVASGIPILTVSNLQKHYGYIPGVWCFIFPFRGQYSVSAGCGGEYVLAIRYSTSGPYQLFSHPVPQHHRRNRACWKHLTLSHYLSTEQNLRIVASIKEEWDIDRVLKMVNLDQRKMHRFNTYSLGMKQRAG